MGAAVTRSWRMFAGRAEVSVSGPDRPQFQTFGESWYVKAHGDVPEPVELTEDAAGEYWGWIESGEEPAVLVLVQPHYGMFTMQFHYGPEVEAARGRGEIVRMSCRAVPAED